MQGISVDSSRNLAKTSSHQIERVVFLGDKGTKESHMNMVSFIAKTQDGKEIHLTAFPVDKMDVPNTIPTRQLKKSPVGKTNKSVPTEWHIKTDEQETVIHLGKGKYKLGNVVLTSDDADAV
jgi:hypothetical protein